MPVYTNLVSATLAPRATGTLVMDGGDRADRGPDGEAAFLSRSVISLTYMLATDASRTQTRDDVLADLRAGTMRVVTPERIANTNITPQERYAITTDVETGNRPNRVINRDTFNAENSSLYLSQGDLQPVSVTVSVFDPTWEETDNRELELMVGQRNYRN